MLVHFWIFQITEDGLEISVYMAIRLIYLIAGSSIMTFTTTPNALTDGIEKLLRPLNKVKVPVHEVAMMMSIAALIPIASGGDRQDHESTDCTWGRSGEWKYHSESKGHDSDSGSVVRIGISPCQ